jgi:hypothetical protein
MNRAPRFIPANTRLEGRCSRAFGLGNLGDRFRGITRFCCRSALEKRQAPSQRCSVIGIIGIILLIGIVKKNGIMLAWLTRSDRVEDKPKEVRAIAAE